MAYRPTPEQRPLTDGEHTAIKTGLGEFEDETRDLLAEELGGDPEDYRPVPGSSPGRSVSGESSLRPTTLLAVLMLAYAVYRRFIS
jgi:hypothetical protein